MEIYIKELGGDDVMQTVPSGMLAFFDGACPKGWTNMSTKGWGGRFLRVAGYDNTMSVNVSEILSLLIVFFSYPSTIKPSKTTLFIIFLPFLSKLF